jgi:hypothetical protein
MIFVFVGIPVDIIFIIDYYGVGDELMLALFFHFAYELQ